MATVLPNDESRRHVKGISDVNVDEASLPPTEPSSSVEETDDGGAIVHLEDESAEPPETGFQDNLVEHIDRIELRLLASELIDLVERDRESRKRRDDQYEEGLRRTGLGDDAPGGASFEGSSKVVHPILAESCVDFASRAMKELFPPSGPVKSQIVGTETDAKIELADRKVRFMNWQTTKNISEYRSELEVLLTQLPMGGSQYMKWWYDEQFGRARCEFIPIDNLLLPYSCTDFYTSARVTHEQNITRQEFKRRCESGLYEEPDFLTESGSAPDTSKTESANERIEGKSDTGYNEDGLRKVYEIYTWREIEQDDRSGGVLAPYIITVDDHTNEVVGMYRNWSESDDSFKKLDWIAEYKLIPWRGAYGIGLPHLIGGISGALTGALRALLDAAHINNSQSLIKLKGGKSNGANITVEPGEIKEIDQVAGVDDIRKTIMAMPYNQPSPVLFQLLDWLTTTGKGVLATANEALSQVGDRTPVGTTMALVEQGSTTYSAIHARMHHSQAKSLEILHRINSVYLDEQVTVEELGELVIGRADFLKTMDIVPVSDPNIFSEAQRFAQMQGVQQLRAMFPMLKWDDNALAQMMLARMRLSPSEAARLLPQPEKPKNLNPVAENMAALHGTPLLALPKQNHMAHIELHLKFATDPVFSHPAIGSKMMGTMLEHVAQHIAFFYADGMEAASSYSTKVGTTGTASLEHELVAASNIVLAKISALLTEPMKLIAKVQELASQYAPKPQMDPAVQATMQVAMAEVDRKKQEGQANLQLKTQELLELKPQGEQLQANIDLIRNQQDNESHQQTELLKNQGDNQTAQFIAAMQAQQEGMMAKFQQQLDGANAQNEQLHQRIMAGIDGQVQQALASQQHGHQMEQNEQQAALAPAPTAPAA
jgi:hypothetical protein